MNFGMRVVCNVVYVELFYCGFVLVRIENFIVEMIMKSKYIKMCNMM